MIYNWYFALFHCCWYSQMSFISCWNCWSGNSRMESRRLVMKISILWKWIYFDKLVGAKRPSSNFGPWGVFGSAVLGSAVLGVCGTSSTVSISMASSSLTRAFSIAALQLFNKKVKFDRPWLPRGQTGRSSASLG